MKLKHNIRLTTILLSVFSGGLLVLLVIVWRWGQERVQAPERLASRHLPQPELSVLSAAALPNIDLAGIRDNAVFYARRTFFQAPSPGQSAPVPEYEFSGSIGLPQGKRVAFVKRKSDKSNRTVHVGDDLDGWRVESISAQQVIIVRDHQQIELKSANDSQVSGLVHGTVAPYVAQSGTRTVGGSAAATQPPQSVSRAARTYQPPAPRN
jgi:hypothetical protein